MEIGAAAARDQLRAGPTRSPDAVAIDQIQHAPVGQVVDGKSGHLLDRGRIIEESGQRPAGVGQESECIGRVFAVGDLAEGGEIDVLAFPSGFDHPHLRDPLLATDRRQSDFAGAGAKDWHFPRFAGRIGSGPMKHCFGGAIGVNDVSRAERDQDRVGAALDDFVKSHSAGIKRVGKSR